MNETEKVEVMKAVQAVRCRWATRSATQVRTTLEAATKLVRARAGKYLLLTWRRAVKRDDAGWMGWRRGEEGEWERGPARMQVHSPTGLTSRWKARL